jgi:hypothetical protein
VRFSTVILVGILVFAAPGFAQRRGSQELGGGVAFWTKTIEDSSVSNLELIGLWSTYFNKDFLFELLPSVTLHFVEKKTDASGLLLGQFSHKIVDLTNIDRQGASTYQRKHEQSTGGIYASAGGGLWIENGTAKPTFEVPQPEKKVYSGLGLSVGLGTHSMLGSLTIVRSNFQYIYLLPAAPLYDKPRSMFAITIMFSVISVL